MTNFQIGSKVIQGLKLTLQAIVPSNFERLLSLIWQQLRLGKEQNKKSFIGSFKGLEK
ncbi:hypothetical protein [Microbulbifer sp. JMSA008]|uniref:hypothetical protein n=1 Tax=Microbulbifer sp. JMSA008 TaxID=3243373 RepID=UPI004039A435